MSEEKSTNDEKPVVEKPVTEESRADSREERRAEREEARDTRREERASRRPSLFWPLVLIGAGVLWLLSNFDVITGANLNVLWNLWPLILIVIGLDLLVGRRSPFLSSLIGLLAVALVIVLVIVGPSIGLASGDSPRFFDVPVRFGEPVEVKSDSFSAPLDDAESANVDLDLSAWMTTVEALSDSDDLITADLDYTGEIQFDVTEGRNPTVRLREEELVFGIGPSLDFDDHSWDIGLSPEVPLDLFIDGGSGLSTLNLDELHLSEFELDGGSGAVRLSLPAGDPYESRLEVGSGLVTATLADDTEMTLDAEGGSGLFTLNVGDDTDLEMEIDAGSGAMIINLPDDAAARVEVDDEGSGVVVLPPRLDRVDDGNDDDRDTGTWETDGFDNADHQIIITVREMGSGAITVR
jgi:hypothetical protein